MQRGWQNILSMQRNFLYAVRNVNDVATDLTRYIDDGGGMSVTRDKCFTVRSPLLNGGNIAQPDGVLWVGAYDRVADVFHAFELRIAQDEELLILLIDLANAVDLVGRAQAFGNVRQTHAVCQRLLRIHND